MPWMSPNLGAKDVTKPYDFLGFGAMDVTKPCTFIGFGAMDVTKPYTFIRFGAMDVTKPYEFIRFGACSGPYDHETEDTSKRRPHEPGQRASATEPYRRGRMLADFQASLQLTNAESWWWRRTLRHMQHANLHDAARSATVPQDGAHINHTFMSACGDFPSNPGTPCCSSTN